MNHKEGTLFGFQKVNIYYQYWLPEAAPKAILLLIHGLGDHSSRFQTFVNYFVKAGYGVCALDLRGHGKSGGIPGYVSRFCDYLADLNLLFEQVCRDFSGIKLFLVGHSIGGTIATAFTISHQDSLSGLVVSAPVLKPGAIITKQQMSLAKILSVILPKMGIAPIEAAAVSRRPEVVEAYIDDPLVYHGKISARLGAELLNAFQRELPPRLPEIVLPILIMYGSEDRLSNPEGCVFLFNAVKSNDKTLQKYEGLYHEIFNEPERQKVYADTENWLSRHL